MTTKIAYRGSIFYFKETATMANLPRQKDSPSDADCQYIYIEDGVLIVEAGKIVNCGHYSDLKPTLVGIELVDYTNKLITPGFIDTHQHATQSAIVALR